MKRQKMILISLVLVLSLALAACSSTAGATKVRVATDATWPPFEMVDEISKEIIGFDIDLLNAVAEKGGFEVEFINVGFDPLLAGISQCQYDAAISAITITEDRKLKRWVSLTHISPLVRWLPFGLITPILPAKIRCLERLLALRSEPLERSKLGICSGVTFKTYDDVGLAFQDLMNGQIDAVIADNPLALGYVGQNSDQLKTVGEVFTDENYGIAVCKTNTELFEKMNKGLAAVKAEGLIDQLTEKWIETGE